MLSLLRWFNAALYGRDYGASYRASTAESEASAAPFLSTWFHKYSDVLLIDIQQ